MAILPTDKLKRILFYVTAFTALLALVVVILGAYTRLRDAGLGCPDWPGCYGQLSVPTTAAEIHSAQELYPTLPVEAQKAWPEMIHRYFAGTLGLFIFAISAILLFKRRELKISWLVPVGLIALVLFQAALGMWTVTWLLLPLVVMGHLMGGMTILALLVWGYLYWLDQNQLKQHLAEINPRLFPFAVFALVVVFIQIALGGWTSANYAALVCPDFPSCNGELIPKFELKQAFNFLTPIGANFQGGLLDFTARVTIQFFHRLGALVTFVVLGSLSILLWRCKNILLRASGIILFLLLLLQISLGILNVVWLLPLAIAVSHNAVGALLLVMMTIIVYFLHLRHKEIAE